MFVNARRHRVITKYQSTIQQSCECDQSESGFPIFVHGYAPTKHLPFENVTGDRVYVALSDSTTTGSKTSLRRYFPETIFPQKEYLLCVL